MFGPPIFNVSGVNGASGRSGASGSSGTSYNRHGQRGGDGIAGQCGTSAGTIAVRLTTLTTTNIPKNEVLPTPVDADVKLEASIVCAGQLQKMDKILRINSGESMCFHALGGHGGNGGNGGHGGHGANGSRYGAFPVFSFNTNALLNTLGEQGVQCN